MSEKKIVVPQGMLLAAVDGFEKDCSDRCGTQNHIHGALEAALRWLSDNPIVPTDEQIRQCAKIVGVPTWNVDGWDFSKTRDFWRQWQNQMFIAEPEVPEAIKDLLFVSGPAAETDVISEIQRGELDKRILEAYRRGKESK